MVLIRGRELGSCVREEQFARLPFAIQPSLFGQESCFEEPLQPEHSSQSGTSPPSLRAQTGDPLGLRVEAGDESSIPILAEARNVHLTVESFAFQ